MIVRRFATIIMALCWSACQHSVDACHPGSAYPHPTIGINANCDPAIAAHLLSLCSEVTVTAGSEHSVARTKDGYAAVAAPA